MNSAPRPDLRPPSQPNAAMSARLSAIEMHLDEIITRLDELKNLLAMLDGVQPNRQRTVEDDRA
ncbi:MAG: hypothetical protein ACRDKX_09810 [Solirubrobacterales bacterium]